jgi:hypothetical protein
MKPKEAYEARKAARKAAKHQAGGIKVQSDRDEEMFDLFDRFVTAVERIADALEAKP